MKTLNNNENFPESHLSCPAHFLLLERIQKVANAITKEFPKAATASISK
jgi:hypothetical protein